MLRNIYRTHLRTTFEKQIKQLRENYRNTKTIGKLRKHIKHKINENLEKHLEEHIENNVEQQLENNLEHL